MSCYGIVRNGFHILCYRRADKTGLCKRHRAIVASGNAVSGKSQFPEPPA